jgi:hypothetical protein
LNIQATNTKPFVIQLRSVDNNLDPASPGAANFGNDSSPSWPIATAAGGITNFSVDKFSVDASAFANDLAGGKFSVQTNGNSLLLVFTSRPPPPVFADIVFNGANLVFSGSGGVTGDNYLVLTTTNLSLPLADWTRLVTNQFEAGGGFRFTNRPAANSPQQFYMLQLP